MEFVNDYHIIVNFGKYKGLKIMELPGEYQDWILRNVKAGPVPEALKRIKARKGVTTLIREIKTPSYIPELIEITASLEPVERPKEINPALFGSFIEYLVKSLVGVSIDDRTSRSLRIGPCPRTFSNAGTH
jgi:uncharacterized protein (DUF3820 family)